MWYVKDDATLGYLDTAKDYRLSATLTATAVSRKLLAFQVRQPNLGPHSTHNVTHDDNNF